MIYVSVNIDQFRFPLPASRGALKFFMLLPSAVRHLTIDFTNCPDFQFNSTGYRMWDFDRYSNLQSLRLITQISEVGDSAEAQSRLSRFIEKLNGCCSVLGKLTTVQPHNTSNSLTNTEFLAIRQDQETLDTGERMEIKCYTGDSYTSIRTLLEIREEIKTDFFNLEIRNRSVRTEEWFWDAPEGQSLGHLPRSLQ